MFSVLLVWPLLPLVQDDRGVTVRIDVPTSLRLSDTLLVALTVEGGEGLQVDSPPVADSTEWRVVRQTKGVRKSLGDGRWQWQREVELEPNGPGKLKLPEIVLSYRTASDREMKRHPLEERFVEVPGPERSDVRGQVPIEAIPDSPSGRFPIPQALAGIVLLAIVAGVVWWRRRPRPTVILPAEVRALRELERLREAPPESTHAGVSVVVRRFVEERFALQAPRQTSEEILDSAQTSEVFPQHALEPLTALLAECDRVKFTGTAPTPQDCEAIVTQGCQFIQSSLEGGKG